MNSKTPNTNFELNDMAKYTVNDQSTHPFASWWWCATIIGAPIVCVLNMLLSKKNPTALRVQHNSIDSVFSGPLTQEVNYENVSLNPLAPPQNFVPNPLPNISEISVTSDILKKRPEDYVDVTYTIHDHPYINDLLADYDWQVIHGIVAAIDHLEEPNQDMVLACTQRNTTSQHRYYIHIPTVITATRDLFGLLEDARKHFKANCNRRLSRQEINYYFGKHMITKVINHLSNDNKFQIDGINMYATAQEVIYLFLQSSGRVLPHRHLLDDDSSMDDLEWVHPGVILPVYWEDNFGKTWELEGPFVKAHVLALGGCLFQFPTAELITVTLLQ